MGANIGHHTLLDNICFIKHNVCMKQHIYSLLARRRRMLGISQQELAARAGLRREKVNRFESKGEDIWVDELCRLLDAVGLELSVSLKGEADSSSLLAIAPSAQLDSPSSHLERHLVPEEFHKASFIDGSKAKILNWGKVPR